MTKRVFFQRRCHSTFPEDVLPGTIKLVVYNLGYLPGGDKTKTTHVATTLQSLHQAQALLQKGGVISITCYPGHKEGAHEQNVILNHAARLPPKEWSCCHHMWLNRQQSPSLLLIQKAKI